MADGPQHKLPHRRRREQKTDYDQRLELLKSGKVRAVVRRTNNHARIQFVQYRRDGDETVTAAHSKQLDDYGWDHHTGNLPAAYLTGYLAGHRAQDAGIQEAVIDLGLQNSQHGTRIFAAIKGLVDAGLAVNVDDEVFPEGRRVHGAHIDEYKDTNVQENVEEVKEQIEAE
jgi:large subunit ribosomal protein L18